MAVDGGDGKPVARFGLGQQASGRGDSCERDVERHGKPAGGGEPHPHAGEAAGSGGDRDQRQRAPVDAGLAHHIGDHGHEAGGLVSPLLSPQRQRDAIANDRHAEPAHGTIERQHEAHGTRVMRCWREG